MFLNAMQSHDTVTANNAVSHSTSGSHILDYFYRCGSYSGRTETEVNGDMGAIFGENQELALKVLFYNRLITRKCNLDVGSTEKVQRGQGRKDEFIKGLKWLESNYPGLVYDNLWLIPTVGCWKDLWYDSPTGFYHYLNPNQVYQLISVGMNNTYHRQLIAKYLPKIRSNSNITNDRHRRLNTWARGLCEYLGWTEKEYRLYKSSPDKVAHLWQREMCDNDWDKIDFNKIPGKALFNLANSVGKDKLNTLERHGLTNKYLRWVDTQPTVKFTGYVHELLHAARNNRSVVKTYTLNKQFEHLLKIAKDGVNPDLLNKGVLCALDTSASMTWFKVDGKYEPYDICIGLGIFFSSLIEGSFKDHVISFSNVSKLVKLSGTFCDKVDYVQSHICSGGSTNFQSVIDEIVRVRRANPNIPVEEYPKCILVVSDMQFNPTHSVKTNYEMSMQKLSSVGLPKMTLIWWQLNGSYGKDVPVKLDTEGTVLISGFDGSIVTQILGGEKKTAQGDTVQLNPYEQMLNALDQEVLNLITI